MRGGFAPPGPGQLVETGAGAEVGEIGGGCGVVGELAGLVEVGGEPGTENRGVEQFPEPRHRLGLGAGFGVQAEVLQRTSEPDARLPVVRKVDEDAPERLDRGLEPVVVFQVPPASKPPVAGVPMRLGPGVEELTTLVLLADIRQRGHEPLRGRGRYQAAS